MCSGRVASVAPTSNPLNSASTSVLRLPFHQSSATRPVSPGRSPAARVAEHVVHGDLQPRGLGLHVGRRERVHEPREAVADGRLSRLVREHAGDDAVLDHAGHARHQLLAFGKQRGGTSTCRGSASTIPALVAPLPSTPACASISAAPTAVPARGAAAPPTPASACRRACPAPRLAGRHPCVV